MNFHIDLQRFTRVLKAHGELIKAPSYMRRPKRRFWELLNGAH